jgi:LPXTG-motif cell wall-anchored protein
MFLPRRVAGDRFGMAGWRRGEWRQQHRQDEEAIVRNPVRKLMGVALVGVLGALFALPMLTAGAQEGGPPPSPGDCTFDAAGTAPGTVTGSVTAPEGATQITATFTPDPGEPGTVQVQTFAVPPQVANFSFDVTGTGVVTANFSFGNGNAYATGCTGPGGVAAIAISRAPTAPTQAAAAQALAFTGSSNTPSYVLIGIAAVVLGAVLVVAARRRSQLS